MLKSIRLLVIALAVFSSGLTACNLGPPDCLEMPAPVGHRFSASEMRSSPPWHDLGPGESETAITFKWDYPGACLPDRFRILLNDVPILTDVLLYQQDILPVPGPTVIDDHGSAVVSYSWTSSETFPAGSYWYWVIPYSGSFYHGESSGPITYIIFKDCEIYTPDIPVELIYPANADVINSLSPSLVWRDRNPQTYGCNNHGAYILLYSQVTDDLHVSDVTIPDFGPFQFDEVPGVDAFQVAITNRSAGITLPQCRRTYWQIYNIYYDSIYHVYTTLPTETHYFDIDPSVCGSISTETSSVSSPPRASMKQPANCRSGPTSDYPLLSILPAGGQYEIRARNTAGDSWMVLDPVINETCWVYGDMVEVVGDTSLVQVIDPEPPTLVLPTETPQFNCAQYNTNQPACSAEPACKWDPNNSPNSPCVNK